MSRKNKSNARDKGIVKNNAQADKDVRPASNPNPNGEPVVPFGYRRFYVAA